MKPSGTLPDSVSAVVKCGGHPTPGLFVDVRIATSSKNDFNCVFGPTDATGLLEFTRDDLLRQAARDRNLSLMDYGHPEANYAGRVEVSPMGRERLRGALRGYETWRSAAAFPPQYAERLRTALSMLERLAPARLEVELTVSGGYGEVVGLQAEA
jgi:hypothetical protein